MQWNQLKPAAPAPPFGVLRTGDARTAAGGGAAASADAEEQAPRGVEVVVVDVERAQ